jgi:hypothetical protein
MSAMSTPGNGAASAPAAPRPHRRARSQLLYGLLPLLVLGVAALVLLLVRLSDARAPLTAATASGQATVQAVGQPPGGRGLRLAIDDGGRTRTGVLVLPGPSAVDIGTRFPVAFDPRSPVDATDVHVAGDAADRRAQDLAFGVVAVVLVLVGTAVLTGLRLVGVARLRRAAPAQVTASRVVVRQGLLVRSWLELVTSGGVRWLPVHWAPELARLAPDTPLEARGDPVRGRRVLPVVDGAEIWPSGRLRGRTPRGERQVTGPGEAPEAAGWARQLRSDAVALVVAPVLGLLWAFLDGSGAGGFAVATAVAAGLLWWLPQLLGSDPAPPDRD